jgi:hypothetical protein
MNESHSSTDEQTEENEDDDYNEGQDMQQDEVQAHGNKFDLTYILNDMNLMDGANDGEEREANGDNERQNDEPEDEEEDSIYAKYGIQVPSEGEPRKQIQTILLTALLKRIIPMK